MTEKSIPPDIINLAHAEPFAAGMTRRCYVHPHNPALCVKIVIPGAEKKERLNNLPFYSPRRLMPLSHFNPNLHESQGYRHAEAMRSEAVWNHIPRFHGFVKTDLGTGLMVELLRHDDGDIATPLDKRLLSGADDSCRRAFAEFCRFMLTSSFYTNSLCNVLCVRNNEKERLYLAECKYRRPGLTHLPFVRHKRLLRMIARLEKKFNQAAAI